VQPSGKAVGCPRDGVQIILHEEPKEKGAQGVISHWQEYKEQG